MITNRGNLYIGEVSVIDIYDKYLYVGLFTEYVLRYENCQKNLSRSPLTLDTCSSTAVR